MRVLTLIILIYSCSAYGQRSSYDTIRVGHSTTVHLIFDSDIQDHVLGSGELVDENERVYTEVGLQQVGNRKIMLAANVVDFSTTNLFIETTAGYFSYILEYVEFPEKLLIQISNESASILKDAKLKDSVPAEKQEVSLSDTALKPYQKLEMLIKEKALKATEIARRDQGVEYFVSGIYTNGNEIGFKIAITNRSNITYQLAYINWTLKQKGNSKKRKGVVDLIEPTTDKILNMESISYAKLGKGQTGVYVYVFPKFTMSSTSELSLEFGERDGDRISELIISNKQFLKAEILDGE